eukprot:gene41872-55551_t
MRVIFAGTPEFARVALEKLHAAGVDIALVLTQPDRPAGRGLKLQASPVKQWAQERNIPVAQPRSLRLDGKYPDDAQAAKRAIDAAQADVMVVAAYGLILPQWVLDTPRLGCLNIHASLLPRWRGAAPIHRAIEAGDTETGITIMQMDAGLDTGDMLLRESLDIGDDSTACLHDRLAVELLEPQGPDSLFRWAFFDSVLDKKEHFSDYVFEDEAERLLQDEPGLRERFEAWKSAHPELVADPQAVLGFIFEQATRYAEPEWRRYPVLRLMEMPESLLGAPVTGKGAGPAAGLVEGRLDAMGKGLGGPATKALGGSGARFPGGGPRPGH